VSHAQLFLGPEGAGGLALALAYAQYVNCENKQSDDSCGQCSSCRKYEKLIHPDLHFSYPFFAKGKDDIAANYMQEWRKAFLSNPYMGLGYWRDQLEAENKQANINIAEAHDIIKKLGLKAYEAEYKVLIMWLPEYLDTQGNALLKLIEEPPEKTLFLLVPESQDKILNTIISRTQLVKIQKLGHEEIKAYLMDQSVAERLASEIAFIADGNMHEALALAHQTSENKSFDLLVSWLRYIVTDNGVELIPFCEEELSKLGRENQKSFLLYALNIMRQIILMQQGLKDLVFLQQEEYAFVEKFSTLFQFEQLKMAIDMLEKAHYGIERNGNPKILFLDLSLQLVLLFKYQTFPRDRDSIYIK
jgi:DNA polymerase-3 subunit delta'